MKSKVYAGRVMTFMCALTVCSVVMAGCGKGSFEGVRQTVNEIELGEKIKPSDCIAFDSEIITEMKVSDDGGFDINTPGNYTITYLATNKKGNTKDFQYNISIKDTTAPILTLNTPEVFLNLGDKFNVDDYATSTDASGTQQIKIDGDTNFDSEGEFLLDVYSEDASGNTSEVKNIIVKIEKRNCDIRNAQFGDSKDVVERYEEEKGGVYSKGKVSNTLSYDTTAAGVNVKLIYAFNQNDELFAVVYAVVEDHSNFNEYYNDFQKVETSLTEKYGKPNVQDVYKSSLFEYCNDMGEAISLGQVAFNTKWELDNMTIYHNMKNDNGVQHHFNYVSKEYEETKDTSGF